MKAEDLGDRLREAMEAKGVSKLQFSRQLQARRADRKAKGEPPLRKVDRPALYAFLDGRDVPPVDTLGEMADLLDVRLGWLAEGEEPAERHLAPYPPPIWLVDGHRGPSRPPELSRRLQARRTFREAFYRRSRGFEEAEPIVRIVFQELLARRLARRRSRGYRGPADFEYRAATARSLYLKCFLDVLDELPPGVRFSSPEFTAAFLERVAGWLSDEEE